MSATERKATYFERVGPQNTDVLLQLVRDYAEKEGIKYVVVASTTGETGAKAARILNGCNVVVVTHCFGFKEPGTSELQEEYKKEMLANNAKIFTGTHALSSVVRAVRRNFSTLQPLELMANTLRLMGEGTKVCIEIALMAADAGLIPTDKDVVAVAGTGRGADTALRIRPANSARFFDLRIREVIAKPSSF